MSHRQITAHRHLRIDFAFFLIGRERKHGVKRIMLSCSMFEIRSQDFPFNQIENENKEKTKTTNQNF